MAIETTAGGTTYTGEHVEAFRLLSLKGQLKLETKGLKSRHSAALKQAIRDICGSTKKQAAPLLKDYEAWLVDQGYLTSTSA